MPSTLDSTTRPLETRSPHSSRRVFWFSEHMSAEAGALTTGVEAAAADEAAEGSAAAEEGAASVAEVGSWTDVGS